MARLDVVRSLVRSTARSLSEQITALPVAPAVRRFIEQARHGLSRTVVYDAQLTAAVGHMTEVSAATVRSSGGRVRVDVSFDDGEQVLMALRPDGIAFAPMGAKEIAFLVEPRDAGRQNRSRVVMGAIAGELARALWKPALMRAPRSIDPPFVTNDDGRLIVDLRSMPEVRWALQQRLYAAVLEVMRPAAIEVGDGCVILMLSLEGFLPR